MDSFQVLREQLNKLPKEKILDYLETVYKNFWTLQNNWMVQTEKKYGHEVATDFDTLCFGRQLEVAAYRLKSFLKLGNDIPALIKVFEWGLIEEPGTERDLIQVDNKKMIYRVTKCAMQLARKERGAPELPCKPAHMGCIDKMAKAVNPKFEVLRSMAPPDKHPEDVWCEAEIGLRV